MKSMPEIKGIPIEKGERLNFVWNADLVSFDGPLISLFKKGDDDFLFVWVDCDVSRNRWLIVPVERNPLQDYLTQHSTLLSIMKDAKVVWIFESTMTAQRRNYRNIEVDKLPESYLPKRDSYLSNSIATEAAIELANDLPSAYRIELDGELYLEDLASVPKLYQQLYSFHYGLKHVARPAVKEALSNLLKKWRGGINAVNIFTGLRSVTPSIHRAQVKGLQYASPGYIKLELLPGLAGAIRDACSKIEGEDDFAATEELYSEIYRYFRSERLSGFDRDSFAGSVVITHAQSIRLSDFVTDYFNLMGWSQYAGDFATLNLDPLAKIRMLLAYYRRLRGLRKYIAESRVRLS